MRLEARRFAELDLLQRGTVCDSGYARSRYMIKLRYLLRPSRAICAYAKGSKQAWMCAYGRRTNMPKLCAMKKRSETETV